VHPRRITFSGLGAHHQAGLIIELASPSVHLYGPAPEAASKRRLQLDARLVGALAPGA
jgi:hypothetical protein